MLRSWLRFHVGLLLVLPPFLIGAVHLKTHIGLAALSTLFLLLFGLRQATQSSPAMSIRYGGWFWLFLAALVWTLLQCIPLPANLLSWLSPEADRVYRSVLGLPKLYPSTELKWFQSISLSRGDTLAKWIRDIAAFCLFFGVLQWCHTRKHLQQMIRVSVLGATALIVLTFVQTALNMPSPLLGLYTPQMVPLGFLKGAPFINYNHLGGYLLFHAILGFWLTYHAKQGKERWIWFLIVTTLSIGIFATLSRGAILVYMASIFAFLFLLGRKLFTPDSKATQVYEKAKAAGFPKKKKMKGKHSSRDIKPLWEGWAKIWYNTSLRYFLLIAIVCVGIGLHLLSVELGKEFSKTKWNAQDDKIAAVQHFSAPLLRNYARVGVGRGAMAVAWPRFSSVDRITQGQRTITHVESQWIQPLVDWGWLFGSIFLLCGVWLLWRLIRNSQGLLERTCLLAMGALLLQNSLDFNLEFLGTAFPFLAILAGLQRLQMQRKKTSSSSKRSAIIVPIGLALLCGIGVLSTQSYARQHSLENAAKRWTSIAEKMSPKERPAMYAILHNHPSDFTGPLHLAHRLFYTGHKHMVESLRWLNIAEQLNPTSVSVWMLRAHIYSELKLFRQATLELSKAVQLRSRLLARSTRLIEHYKFTEQVIRYSTSAYLTTWMMGRWMRKHPQSSKREAFLKSIVRRFPKQTVARVWYIQHQLYKFKKLEKHASQKRSQLSVSIQKLIQEAQNNHWLHKGVVLFLNAQWMEILGKKEKAVRLYAQSSKLLHSHHWHAMRSMLQLLKRHRDYKKMIRYIQENRYQFHSNSHIAHLYSMEAYAYAKQKKYSNAIQAVESAIALHPQPTYRFQMAHICKEQGRYRCALRIYRSLSKQPRFKHLQKTIDKWERIQTKHKYPLSSFPKSNSLSIP